MKGQCLSWTVNCAKFEDVCKVEEMVCKEMREECVSSQTICLEYRPAGTFCQDQAYYHNKPCQRCPICQFLQTAMDRILEFSNDLHDKSYDEDKNIKIDDLILR